MTAPVVLSIDGVTRRFGSVRACDSIDLALYGGEVVALLGENGAGKTTLMDMVAGRLHPDSGTIRVADETGALQPLPPGEPRAAIAAGIGMVQQHFALAGNLTGFDNIVLGTEPLGALFRRRRAARERLAQLMAESGLDAPLDIPVARLSVGERQRVEILKALYREPRVLVLDEPTAVLTPQEADLMFATLTRLAEGGLAVLFVSHKLREVMAFADRIAVLRAGRKVAELLAVEADAAGLARLMVGAAISTPARPAVNRGAPLLRLEGVTVAPRPGRPGLRDVSFTVHAHEIVGLAGVSGHGQAALAALVAGMAAPAAGRARLGEGSLPATPRDAVRAGIGHIPEDRLQQGIAGDMSVAENLVIERLHDRAFTVGPFLRRRAIRDFAARLIAAYDLRGPGPRARARLLSGGNIQKLVLARVLEAMPRLIVADQPTRGLDIGAIAALWEQLFAARARGAGVLVISEDLDALLALSDRLLVIHGGRIMEAGPAGAVDRRLLGLMMAGRGPGLAA